MAPNKSTLLKWSQEEVDILVEMTNDQLELEAQDRSMLISWTTHWKKVAQRLKEHGHNRTPTACRGIWRRGVQEQQANRDAAGGEWDESEHEILVHMTKKQLDFEKADPVNVISWARHWKKVSLQLEESGYSKNTDNCAAYWALVKNDVLGDTSELAGGDDDDADDRLMDDVDEEGSREPTTEADESDDAEPAEPAVTSPQASSKVGTWSVDEYENLLGLLKDRRQREADEGLEMLSGSKLWTKIAQSHRESGFDRSWIGCKAFWNKQGRERSGYDEQVKLSPRIINETVAQPVAKSSTENPSDIASNTNLDTDPPKPSKPSSAWSTVNEAEAEEIIVVPRNPAIDVLKKFQKDHAIENQTYPDQSYTRPNSPEFVFVESDLSQEQVQARKQRGTSQNSSSTPTQSGVSEKGSSGVKFGLTSFRFSAEQRAVLEAEAHRTGGTLEGGRKTELAEELGVEEKTVRNWFNNYNVKARRSQGSTPAASVSTPTFDEFHDSRRNAYVQFAATPTPSVQGFVAPGGSVPKRPFPDDGSPNHSHPPKRPQLEAQVETFTVTSGFNPVNGHSNRPPPQEYSTASLPKRPNSRQSAFRAEADGRFNGYSPHPPNRPSNEASSTPQDARLGDTFAAVPANSTEAPAPLPPSHLQLKSTAQPVLNSQPVSNRQPVLNSQPVMNPHPAPNSHPAQNSHPVLTPGSQQTAPNPPHQYPPPASHPMSAPYPNILRDGENKQTSNTSHHAAQSMSQNVDSRRTPESSMNKSAATAPVPSQASPNQQWARPPPSIEQEHVYRAPPKPFSSPAPAQTPAPTPVPAATQAQTPTSVSDPSARSGTSSTPSDEHPRVQALRHMENFRSEIHNLNQKTAARKARVTYISKELLDYASKHIEISNLRDAEIARALRDIDAHYGAMQLGLREKEERLEREKGAEVESLNKAAAELARKEKGLARWQGIVEYYDAEGSDDL